MTVGRDIPSILNGFQTDYRVLYFSESKAALKVPITLQAGYGILTMGTAIAENKSSAGNDGKFLPYRPTTIEGTETAPGRAYILAEGSIGASTVNVTIDDAYKFKVGDDIIIVDDTTTAENLGAITAIDVTTYTHMATITFTTVIGATAFTVARFAHIAVEAGDATNNYSDCVGILEKSVDTGTGINAEGAIATLIVSNCTLYNGMLTNVDAAAIVDLSASAFGQFLVLK